MGGVLYVSVLCRSHITLFEWFLFIDVADYRIGMGDNEVDDNVGESRGGGDGNGACFNCGQEG